MDRIALKVKVQTIYYRTDDDELGKEFTTSDRRVTISHAEKILANMDIRYKEILKVKYEFVEMEIPFSDFKKYIV